jgi:DNA-binding transcriptional ArsR family regulator
VAAPDDPHVVVVIVGAVGVANIIFISVLERRSEIGLRRALGATKGQIRTQFLAESILLALIGGIVGVLAGAAATAVYASSKNWAVVIPAEAWTGGIAAAILIGAFAGLMPAVRASRMPPTGHCERYERLRNAQFDPRLSRVAKPTMSKHVKVLEEAGVVVRTVEGRTHRLSLELDALGDAVDWINRQRAIWERMLGLLDEYLEDKEAR